ncbi:MAG: dockerin type I domain-containing protein, partial [Planctomycetota bacterium]|nr:dockerin type I domain-containing protein [Planctomycetota bacterium]
IYGEIISTGGSTALQYNNVLDAMGFRQVKGPTDPSGPTYDGTCNPDDPMSGCTPAPGPFLFQDLNLAGFRVTPGQFNDVDGTGSGGIVINQFRFVAGDFDFDGDADAEDYRLICAALGAGLDDQEMRPCPGDPNVMINAYVYEGRALNQLLAMAAQDETDGIGGANADEVTDQDAATHRVLIGAGVAPDLNGDGIINASDLGTLLGSWGSDNALADYNKDGVVNAADLSTLLGSWGQH